MEDNSLTPSPAPTPNPGTNMPEFATAPTTKPEPVVASAMPDFGLQQLADAINTSQSAQPQAAQSTPTQSSGSDSVAPQQSQPQSQSQSRPQSDDFNDALAEFFPSTNPDAVSIAPEHRPNFDGISIDPSVNEDRLAPSRPDTQATPQPRDIQAQSTQPAQSTQESQAPQGQQVSQSTQAMQPTQPGQTIEDLQNSLNSQNALDEQGQNSQNPQNLQNLQSLADAAIKAPKKSNLKLIAIISVVVLFVVGGIVTIILLLNQPKPKVNNPPTVPVQTSKVDTSTPVKSLTKENGLEFLEAVSDFETYYPENYADEKVVDFLNDSKNITFFFSYANKSSALNDIKTTPAIASFKDRLTKNNTEIEEQGDYSTIKIDETAIKCGKNCVGFAFSKESVNLYADPSGILHIVFTKNTQKDIEKNAPLAAAVFLNGKKVYSTEFKTVSGTTHYYVHTLEYDNSDKSSERTSSENNGAGSNNTNTSSEKSSDETNNKKSNVNLKTFVFTFDPSTKEMLYRPDLETNQLLK